MIDYDMSIGKFYAMVTWADKNVDDFFEVYYQSQQSTSTLTPVYLYHPAYYQSMCSRLYNFGGTAWVPQQSTVISWTLQSVTDNSGHRLQVKVISDVKSFASYGQAEAFVSANPGYIIVGNDPFSSPVPLEKLEHYSLTHQSPTTAATQGNVSISSVEIFEYSP
jgi:hypothetical protein